MAVYVDFINTSSIHIARAKSPAFVALSSVHSRSGDKYLVTDQDEHQCPRHSQFWGGCWGRLRIHYQSVLFLEIWPSASETSRLHLGLQWHLHKMSPRSGSTSVWHGRHAQECSGRQARAGNTPKGLHFTFIIRPIFRDPHMDYWFLYLNRLG